MLFVLRPLIQAFTSPVAGPVGFALAIVMCGLLVATSLTAARNEAALRARVGELSAQNLRTGAVLHARLAACEGATPGSLPRGASGGAAGVTETSAQARAERLAGSPVGFDVCARMESADRAVLETLR
jgi:hypothetical protein